MAATALGAAFEAKGVNQRNVKLQIAVAEFQNNGGEWGVAYAILCAAYGKGSGGQMSDASDGQKMFADASPRTTGQPQSATKVALEVAPVAAQKPGHARRGAAAITSVQTTLTKSLFETIALPDGRKLGEVRWSECPTLATKYTRLSRILLAVHRFAIPPDPSTTLDAVVPEAELKNIVSVIERNNEV